MIPCKQNYLRPSFKHHEMTSQNNQMTKFLIALSLSLSVSLNAVQKPNILIIIADDCTFSDLPINGGQNAKTPHLDAFAKQSLIFNRAYLGMAMCSPCRSELYTGRYPHRNGCAWNHGTCRPGTRSMPHILKPQGYRVGLAGKTHVKPKAAFPFEKIPGFDQNCVRNPTQPHDLSGSKEFVTRDRINHFALSWRLPNHTHLGSWAMLQLTHPEKSNSLPILPIRQ
jgi:uncharacterized sulfatase